MRSLIVTMSILACANCSTLPLSAAIDIHNTQASWLAAAGGTPTILNFDSTPLGTFIPNNSSLGGITFQYGPSFGAAQLRVTNGTFTTASALSTTSGTRFLGTDVSGDQLAVGGANNFSMVFSAPVRSVGLFIIVSNDAQGGAPPVLPGDLSLTAGGTSVPLGPASTTNVPAGSQAFFLGLTENTGAALGVVTLSSDIFSSGYRYRVDDISFVAVPEPSALAGGLWLLAMVGPLSRSSRRRRSALPPR